MITRNLVKHCLQTRYEDIPEEVVLHAKRSLLNWAGCAVGASHHQTVELLLDVARLVQSAPQAVLLGRSERVDLLTAVLVNGTSSHVFDFDDTHLDTIHHPSGPVAPVCLALGEHLGSSGQDVLRAFVLGVETELRISNAIYPSHYDLGWHITSTAGVFGAAMAGGLLLSLKEEEMLYALGLAGTQAFGLREMFGTMTKPFHPGKAAQNGLLSALLAARGFTSSTGVLEAKRGFAQVLSPSHDLSRVCNRWGEEWELLKNAFKPYACGIVLHPAIEACIELRSFASPEETSEIILNVNPYVLELTGKKTPATGLEGKFSVYHSAAIAFLDGDASEEQYSDARVNAPDTIRLREKVRPFVDPSLKEDQAVAILRTKDGREFKHKIEQCIGSIGNPMSDDMIGQKAMKLAAPVIGQAPADAMIRGFWELDNLERLDGLLAACSTKEGEQDVH